MQGDGVVVPPLRQCDFTPGHLTNTTSARDESITKKINSKTLALSLFYHMGKNEFVRVTSWWKILNFGHVSRRSLSAQRAARSLARSRFQPFVLVYSGARQVTLKALGRVVKTHPSWFADGMLQEVPLPLL